ncbi:PotD/PotF family extracellular solute-binding protein [Microbacterium sp. MPKO10]|uniref:ABC transporter substrate-binding protein n=1 Tax=Microbacterium sp. MPKO10 TaxID=2989818 RepID=UPI002235D057|nr:extracellular solute-binding protein [Microbacterium sp. MPKO10]MCW4459938.1 extracellular solute-binding protein [Microbacterium sp. MPKO10]
MDYNDNTGKQSLDAIRSRLSRRGFLVGAAGLAAASTLSACSSPFEQGGSGSSGGGKKLSITMFVFLGGDLAKMPKEFAKEYMESNPNVSIEFYEQSNSVGYGKMLAQRKADPEKPLVNMGFFNTNTSIQGIGDEMWEPLDYSAMSNAADIRSIFQRDDSLGIGIGTDQYGLLMNPEALGSKPASWSSLWDPAYKGQVSFFNFPWYAVYTAALANGGGLDNMEPGWELWEERADQIKLIVESNPQYMNVLSDGTAPLTSYFAGTGQQWINGGAPLEYVVPEEGAIPLPVFLQSVADQGDDEKEVCQDIINEMLSPKWVTRWAETSIEIPANEKSETPASLADLPAFQQSTVDGLMEIDYDIVGTSQAEWTERWNSDIVSKI